MLITVPGGRDVGEAGQPSGSLAWLRAEAERRSRDFGRPPLVIVDDLRSAIAFSDEVDPFPSGPEFAAARTGLVLRLVARGAGSPVLVLASLAPASVLGTHDAWRPPELKDLEAGSAGLAGNADAILVLWPDGEDWETYEAKDLARDPSSRRPVIVRALKGRQAGPGTAKLLWYPVVGTFEEAARTPVRV